MRLYTRIDNLTAPKDASNYRGIVREVDTLGRIVIPIEWRNLMNLNPGDKCEIMALIDGSILIKKYDS